MSSGLSAKRPKGKRKGFSVTPYTRVSGKKVYGPALTSETLQNLNREIKSGRLSLVEANLLFDRDIFPELKRQHAVRDNAVVDSLISAQNMRLFEKFWAENYRRKKMEAPQTARYQFLAALRFVEPLSLTSASIDALQTQWDSKLKGTPHKRYGARINQLLEFGGRGFKLYLERAVTPPLKYLTWKELCHVLTYIEDPDLQDVYIACWGTGCRIGELFALTPEDYRMKKKVVHVEKQMNKKFEIVNRVKNGKPHDTLIIPEAKPAFDRFVRREDRTAHRLQCWKVLKEVTKKAFTKDPNKHVGTRKLRQSYVKHLLGIGVPLQTVANYIGDTPSTAQSTYAQWEVSTLELDMVEAILERAKKAQISE